MIECREKKSILMRENENCYCQVVAGPKIAGVVAGAVRGRGGAYQILSPDPPGMIAGVARYAVNIIRN